LAVGAAHEVVTPGKEVEAAERWIRSDPEPRQPWDRPGWRPLSHETVSSFVTGVRRKVVAETQGHYPAPLAILDCVERGMPLSMDQGMAQEIDVFGHLIQRPEPRNMIQTLFLGKLDYEKRKHSDTLPANLAAVRRDVAAALAYEAAHIGDLDAVRRRAGFTRSISTGHPVHSSAPVSAPGMESANLWFEHPASALEKASARLLVAAAAATASHASAMSESDQRAVDYALVTDLGFPSYVGGPFALLRYLGAERIDRLLRP
jgi:3-hydroxyacyl-CoA dehydrogenase/enoyl-CoA hydratase/3-hydroxybutyryl-CoA epimerase